ncbi:MAG: hypothetical protein MPN21_23035 [Thermoanaerobaculia bacterium]|nr:hypothetical protein [Thermoanaerobaculia bacterium]
MSSTYESDDEPIEEAEPFVDSGDPVDRFIDELMPDGLEWRRMVRSYPRASLAAAAVGGYLLGRNRGLALLGAFTGFLMHQVGQNVEEFLADWRE